jgi:excisionase family DNA binding protein
VKTDKFGDLKTSKYSNLRQYFSVEDVCAYFSISDDTVYRLIREGLLPRIKIFSTNRISIKEVKKLAKRLKVDEFA